MHQQPMQIRCKCYLLGNKSFCDSEIKVTQMHRGSVSDNRFAV